MSNIDFSNTAVKSQYQRAIEKELDEHFLERKMYSNTLADCFSFLGQYKKAERVTSCGTYLEFACLAVGCEAAPEERELPAAGSELQPARLKSANFCRERLCPLCSWRRSLKIFSQISSILEYLGDEYRYLSLTLTVRNCCGDKLSETIDRIYKSVVKMLRRHKFDFIKGSIRILEITRNKKNGTFHPHIHMILAVKESYFHLKQYVKQSEWLSEWRSAFGDETIKDLDIRIIKSKYDGATSGKALAPAVAEYAKYAVKSSDYLVPEDLKLSSDIVSVLDLSLKGRRLLSMSGIFKDAHRALKLDDAENGDLVNVDPEFVPLVHDLVFTFKWYAGAYQLVSVRNEKENE